MFRKKICRLMIALLFACALVPNILSCAADSNDSANTDANTAPQASGSITGLSISKNPDTASIASDGSITLTASAEVSGTTAINYTWTISDTDSASLSADSGTSVALTGKNNTEENKSVTVTLTATDSSGNKKTASTVITVSAKTAEETKSLNGVSISGTTEIGASAGTLTATPSYTGDIASEITYTWEISPASDYATVSGNGRTATITGKNTTETDQSVTVKVTATYGSTSKDATATVKIAGAGQTVTNEFTGLALAPSASSVGPDGTVTITPTVTYTGSLSESDFAVSGWQITSGSDYAVLKVPSTGSARASLELTGDNRSILQAKNTTTSSQTVTVSVKVSYGGVEKTATCSVTVEPSKVTSVSISGTNSISCSGTTELTAVVAKTGNPASITYKWEFAEENEYASIIADGATATVTGTNTTASSHTVTVKVTVSDGTNSVSDTIDVTVEKNYSAVSALFPENGATGAYADTYLELVFDSEPTINRNSSGTVRIYKSDNTLVDTIKPAAETMYGYGYGGNSGLGSINVQYQLIQKVDSRTVRIIPHHNTSTGLTLLENGTSYYVLIDDGLITGTLGGSEFTGITDSSVWAFTTGSAPSVSGNTLTVGSGKQFITVQGALSYLMSNSKTGDWTVKIDAGTYYERIFYSGNANLILSGQGSAEYGTDVEIQWCNQDGGDSTTLWNTGARGRNVFFFHGGDLILENLSIINTATRKSNEYGEYDSSVTSDNANGNNQAEALMFDSTGNCAAYNCNFTSKQDTIYLSPSGGKAWFYGCKIAGDVDFIWGLSDVALFERCNIISAYDSDKSSNHKTYIVASRLATGSAPYGKGFVLYNSTVTTESGQTTYLARSPWGSSGNISQVAIIDTAVTGGLESNPWEGNHVAGDDETVLGWKYYNVTSDGSAISSGNAISASQYAAEFAGRNNIINRTYDGSAFSKASSTWDVNTLASDMGWNVVTDNSKATLDGESEITTVTYDFTAQTSYSAWDSITSISAEDDSTNTATVSGLKWHSTNYGANVSSANSTVSFAVTGACTVTVYNSYTVATDVSLAVGGATVDTGSTSGSDSCTLSYTGTTSGKAVVTIASAGAYISKIVVTYTSSGGGETGDDTTEGSWTWTAADFGDGITTDNTAISDGAELGYVTISGTGATWRVSGSAVYCVQTGKTTNGCLKFTTSETATITIVAASTGSSNTSDAILSTSADTSGAIAEASGATTVTGSNPQTTLTYNNVAAGTYYFGAFPASSNSRGLRVYSITVTAGTASVSSVTISGKTSVEVGSSITLTATPNVSTSSAYAWTVTGGTGSASGSSTTNTLTLTGVTVGTVTVTAGVDGVTSSAFTVTVKEAGSTPTISASDTPMGFASAGTYTTTPTTASYGSYANPVTTYSQLVAAIKAGGLIYVKGMIPLAYYESSDGTVKGSMLPSTSGGTTAALDAFVADKTSYSDYAAWKSAYIAVCETDTDDESYSLCEVGTLYNAYKKIVQLNLISNTTLIGIDSSSGLVGGTLSISNISNVAIRNLILRDAYDPFPHHEAGDGWNSQYDGIVIQNTTSGIWIDHCTIEDTMNGSDATTDYVTNASGKKEHWNPYDGQCDIKGTANSVTVSYCKFKNHDKSMLICSGASDTGTKNVTIMNCGFYGITQRTPLVGHANVHMYNCYFDSGNGNYASSYAIGCRYAFKIIAENNYFTSAIKYSVLDSSSPTGSIYLSGNTDNSNKGVSSSYTVTSAPFDVGYDYRDILSASEVPESVENNAGAGYTVK